MIPASLAILSNPELLEALAKLVARDRHVEAEVLAHLGEVDSRRLYAAEGFPSMFKYCTDVLHFSEAAAFQRIRAARLGRAYPVVMERIRRGEIHLAGVTLLAPHLTSENHVELLDGARYKSKRQIEVFLADRAPSRLLKNSSSKGTLGASPKGGGVRGQGTLQGGMFSYVSLESRIPDDHPLRAMRRMVDTALQRLSPRFDAIYARGVGRPSVPPEQLLRALLLQVLYTIRSERQLVEQLEYNLLYRWFVGLELDEVVFSATVFTKNRDRLLKGEIAEHFFDAVLEQAETEGWVSLEHFTVDGTLIEAWASQKSFVRKDEERRDDDDPGNPTVNFRGEKRSNQTHASTTDPDARLAGMRGQGARLAYQGHVVTENRNGLVVAAKLTQASGYAEREAALEMVEGLGGGRRRTLGGDKGFDTKGFVEELRELGVTPHVAQNTTNRRSAIDGRTTRHRGYELSQRFRKRVEEVFGWMKTVGLMRKTRHRGTDRVGWVFTFTAAAYNLIRIRKLLEAT